MMLEKLQPQLESIMSRTQNSESKDLLKFLLTIEKILKIYLMNYNTIISLDNWFHFLRLIIILKGDTIKVVLDARHLNSNTDQSFEL